MIFFKCFVPGDKIVRPELREDFRKLHSGKRYFPAKFVSIGQDIFHNCKAKPTQSWITSESQLKFVAVFYFFSLL